VWLGCGAVKASSQAPAPPRAGRAWQEPGLARVSCAVVSWHVARVRVVARGSCASWHVGEPRAVCHPQQSFKESSTRNIILMCC